ncbi:Gamma-tubulin complex component 6 [Acipenser ruthenus]|uniref:Gamma-tubulin complex component 6 n=1 Tax=Acipenser ruthenus TaxID=7906 RepID=A0A444UIQ9_ACIRT|nr:Gamma-tubulin complex component 6 [Acipenser ruthenus]
MPGVYVSGTSPDSVASLLEELAEYETHYWRLSRFSLQPVLDSSYKKGLVFQAFTGGVRRYLHYYRACVLSTPPTLSLLTIVFLFRKLGRQLRYLSELCWCGGGTGAQGLNRGAAASFPMGVKLLSYLYNEAQNNCSNENYPVLLSLLKSSCEPYTRFIYDWVYSGVFRDVYGEFMIQVNEDYLSFRDKHFWTQGYLLISKDVEDCVPVFLRHIANKIYISGKTINLLRVCCPRHYICWSELPVPRIAVTFSLQELEEIERDCGVYRGRMERIARYSAIKREEKALRTELARQDLIVQVRETTAKALETVRGRQVSQRLAQEAKKRERFQELKQQLEVEQERRSAARQQEADSDFGFTRELRDRERRLQALEEQLESQARRELIEHYSRLSEEAAARERRALWKVQRHRLETERNSFLQRQQSHIQAMLEKFPLGERREQLDIIPKGDSQRRLPAGGRGDSGEQGAQEILKPQSSDPSIPREHPPALEAEPQESEKPTPDSVQEAPGDPLAHPTGPPKLGEQEPQARLESPGPLDIHDFLPKETPDLPAGTCPVVSAVDAALLDIGSELPEGASGLQQEYDFSAPYSPLQGARLRPRWNTHQHTSQANIQLGQYASDVEPSTPRASVHGHVSEANIKVGQNVSEVQVAKPVVNVHGHSSESNIQLGQYASDVEPSKPRASVHGHVSEATIQLGDESKPTVHSETLQAITEVSEGDPDPGISEQVLELHDQAPGVQLGEYAHVAELPGSTASVPGQASEENLNIMEKASEKELILPHVHIQGHASEEHIKLGGYMTDTEPSKPRVDIHGHASEGSIKVGEDVLDVDQVQPHLSIHGHASDSSIKVGGYVSDSKQTSSHCSVHGHASDSSIKVGGYMSDSEQTSSHCSVHGHASDSSIKVGGYIVFLVNKAIVDYYFMELNVERHCEALRHFLLMEDGEFAQSLSDLLFEKLGSGQTPGELLNPLVLNSILNKSLQYSLHGDSQLAANLTFALRFLPESFHPHAPDALACLELRYKVDWPLNIVITDSCMNKYNRIFSFLLQLKHMVWTLRDVWFHLKRAALVKGAGSSVQFRQLQLYRHEMQHFVKVIQGYIANQILHVTWSEFRTKLGSAANLDDIHRTHTDYLNRAIFRGLLTEKAAPVMNIIHSIFSLILKFRAQLISQPWSSQQGAAEHPSFGVMQQSYRTFKYYSHFLFKGTLPSLPPSLSRIQVMNIGCWV